MNIKTTSNRVETREYNNGSATQSTSEADLVNSATKTSKIIQNTATQDGFIKATDSKARKLVELYNGQGKQYALNTNKASNSLAVDKGTALATTVYINRNAYDRILNATTFGEIKWEETGVDDEKRWVVVNGQRFECEHSPEEKALRKEMRKNFLDYIDESAEKRKKQDKSNSKESEQPTGNIKALKSNEKIIGLLQDIFKAGDLDDLFKQLL